MEILRGPVQHDIEGRQPAARDRDAGQVRPPHGAIGRDHEIAGQLVLKPGDGRFEVGAAALLLAFDQHGDAGRNAGAGGAPGA